MARVLVVDSDPTIVAGCRRALEADGHEVDTASEGKEALRRLAAGATEIVVTEVALPGMDGLDLLYRIRDRYPRLAVVLHCTSAWYGERYASWAADAFLTKREGAAALGNVVRGLAARAAA